MKRFVSVVLAVFLILAFSFCAFADTSADINNDGSVDIRDLVSMKRLIANACVVVPKGNFDIVDGSGNVNYNASDLVNFVDFLLGNRDSFTKTSGTVVDF